jgi:hypothetical protein
MRVYLASKVLNFLGGNRFLSTISTAKKLRSEARVTPHLTVPEDSNHGASLSAASQARLAPGCHGIGVGLKHKPVL